ncbi:MAG: hypothetical protein RXR51_05610 [Nitrososphaeria archaeon]
MQTTAMKYQNYIESEIERKVSAITSEIKKQIVLEEYQDYIESEIEKRVKDYIKIIEERCEREILKLKYENERLIEENNMLYEIINSANIVSRKQIGYGKLE